jgi:aspartate/methionine/tyrosine aminotransferase
VYKKLLDVQQSYSVAFADFVRVQESRGKHIVKMQTGDPDFPTHPEVIDAAQAAMANGHTKYCDSRGLLALREALANKLLVCNNIHADPHQNLLVTHGAVHAVGMAIRAIVNDGDEVIILEPYWRAYESNVILAGGVPVFVRLDATRNFELIADAVLEAITPRTRLIIINTPNNPSGVVFSRTELQKLALGAAERGIYLLCDEVYEALVFDGHHHYSPASDLNIAQWIISIFSFSKTYAMTGWRIGYLCANASLVDEMLKLSQFSVTSLSPFSQMAALHALTSPSLTAYAEKMRDAYQIRLTHIMTRLSHTYLEPLATKPNAAFYMLFEMSKFDTSSLNLAKRIVDESGVAFTPGIAFGNSMDNYLRMCFATSHSNIDLAIDSLLSLTNPP